MARLSTALLLLPQRYVFSSKSQLTITSLFNVVVVVATTKVRIFKQITTKDDGSLNGFVVVATTKVRIFKQITTGKAKFF